MPRRLACRLAILVIGLGGAAQAGPWPREQGQHFLSVATERDRDGNNHTGLYGEYGLRPRLTLGYEIGHTNQGETSALIWLQRSLDDGEGANRLALSFGTGALMRDGETMPMAQLGASWGRGFAGIWDGGWLAADLRVKLAGSMAALMPGANPAEMGYLTPELTTKADLTLGLRPRPSTMLIGQLRLERRRDADLSARLAASVVHDLVGPVKAEFGIIEPLNGAGGERALKIGSWLSF